MFTNIRKNTYSQTKRKHLNEINLASRTEQPNNNGIKSNSTDKIKK